MTEAALGESWVPTDRFPRRNLRQRRRVYHREATLEDRVPRLLSWWLEWSQGTGNERDEKLFDGPAA